MLVLLFSVTNEETPYEQLLHLRKNVWKIAFHLPIPWGRKGLVPEKKSWFREMYSLIRVKYWIWPRPDWWPIGVFRNLLFRQAEDSLVFFKRYWNGVTTRQYFSSASLARILNEQGSQTNMQQNVRSKEDLIGNVYKPTHWNQQSWSFAPYRGIQNRIQDLDSIGLIVDPLYEFLVPFTGFRVLFHLNLDLDSSCFIFDSEAKDSRIPKQKLAGFWNPLHGAMIALRKN